MYNYLLRIPAHVIGTLCLSITIFVPLTLTNCSNKSIDKLDISNNSNDTLPDFPNTPAGQILKKHIQLMSAYGEDAEFNYQASLVALRKDSTMNNLIFEVYKRTNPDQYLLRSLLVESLKELKLISSLGMLNEIASSQIPAETSNNPEYSTRENEILIRSTAIEGISYLVQDQTPEARNFLFALIDSKDITLRQMAIRGYLSSYNTEKEVEVEINKLKKKLPEEDHWMITTRTTDIKTVPHPTMPDSFNLKNINKNNNSPKTKN